MTPWSCCIENKRNIEDGNDIKQKIRKKNGHSHKQFDVFILNASGCAQFDHFWKNILGNLTTQPAVVGSIEIKEQFVCMCGNKDMSRVDSPSPST